MRNIVLASLVALLTVLLSGCGDNSSENTSSEKKEDSVVRWKMASTFPGNLNIIGEGGLNFIKRIDTVSNGSIKIKFFEPGALVPPLEVFDAVSTGARVILTSRAASYDRGRGGLEASRRGGQ